MMVGEFCSKKAARMARISSASSERCGAQKREKVNLADLVEYVHKSVQGR
jgi:hypothetical protein